MCFSASASFITGSVLLFGGVASVNYVKEPKQIPFSVIPLIFSIQQFSEGVLWLSLMDTDWAELTRVATYAFMVFAQVIWPTWMSLSLWMIEKNKKRKKILLALLVLGVAVSIYYAWYIINYSIDATIISNHIKYQVDNTGQAYYYLGIFYFLPTVIASLISSLKYMNLFAVLIFIAYIITQMFFHVSVISVWCFFAAIISLFILIIMRDLNSSSAK